MITIQGLNKHFGSIPALRNIDLSFQDGTVYGIVGENGAGKTTLFRCIAGLEPCTGEIVSDLTPLKNHLGLLLTEPFFFAKITGLEYLRLSCNARGIANHKIEERNIFDLPLNQYASTYSTGMKKKLALTAILLQENQYFILDEPFNGVDIQSNIIITRIILELKKLRKTVLISSHIFSTLKETCDQIFVLKEGVLVKSVSKEKFDLLEAEMKDVSVGNKIDRLGLK